jgi:DNA polymerase-3 subunit beta
MERTMKITIESHKLRDALNKILTVIDKKNSRPILTNCLISVKDQHIHIIATDLEVTAKIILKCEVDGTGSFCINTKNIFDIVRELPDELLSLVVDGESNILKLSCKNINYSLLITNSDEYPQINFESNSQSFRLKANDIAKIINKTSHAISSDETRINLNGIYLQELDSKLRAVAIDGHRLALLDINNFEVTNSNISDGVILPRKGVLELKKIADTYADSDLDISLDESFMYICANEEYFLSIRLIAREYPKYQTVIPSKTTYTMTVDRNAIYDAVKRIRILSNEKTNGVKLTLAPGELTISANHPSLGNAKEVVSVQYEGKDIEIGFNAKYMIETLSVLEVSELIFEFNNELSPVVCRSNELPEFLGIIMPLKL